jgi:hypothetical protein
MYAMHAAPELSLPLLAKFLRQHTHDVCNDLNGLDLEATLLAELAPGKEAAKSVARIHGQIRRLAAGLRGLSAKFNEPKPVRALYAARELFLIWQDQPAALDPAPIVQWSDALGAEQVNVDAAELAAVFRELLANAQAFGTGAPLLSASRVEDGKVAFELREPKDAPVETAGWGSAPFAAMRHGHYGLGLWEAQRTITASGGEVRRHFAKDTMELITTLLFPVA